MWCGDIPASLATVQNQQEWDEANLGRKEGAIRGVWADKFKRLEVSHRLTCLDVVEDILYSETAHSKTGTFGWFPGTMPHSGRFLFAFDNLAGMPVCR